MFKKLLRLLRFRIGYSSGKVFDPRNTKNITIDPIKEMVERDIKRKRGKNGKDSGTTEEEKA